MESKDRRAPTDPFSVNLSGAIVLRGDAVKVRDLIESIKAEAIREGVMIVFVKASSQKLWIKEGDP